MNGFLSDELGLLNSCIGANDRDLHRFTAKNKDCGNWNWEGNQTVKKMAPAGAISSRADDLLSFAKINKLEEKPYLSLCHRKYASLSK